MFEEFKTERVAATRERVLGLIRDDAIRYFAGVPFEALSVDVERYPRNRDGTSEYRAVGYYKKSEEDHG